MAFMKVVAYLVTWSIIGFIAFSVYVVVVFRTGLAFTARKQDGSLKERIPISGFVNMLVLLICIIGFVCPANYLGLARKGVSIEFLSLFGLNFIHYLILFIYDSFIIDGLVLSVWRPKFLRLPNAIGCESMKKHILVSIPVGIIAGVILTSISSVVSYYGIFAR